MSPLEKVLKEAHRRGLWQVLVVFVGGGWGVLGALDMLIDYGYLPDWVFGGGLLALLAGLPVVSATAWIQGGRGVRPPATAGDPADEAILAAAEAGERMGRAAGTPKADDAFDTTSFFTWPRAITGGVLAFALLGVLTAAYMVMRATGIGAPGTLLAQGVLEEGARLVLADFESSAGDAAPGDLFTESLRIDLGQSDAIRLVTQSTVEATLERMRRDPADPITEDLALEIAEREGAPGIVAGEVGRIGSGFVINARVIATDSGEPLAEFRVTADGEDELLGAIDELARAMRDKIGESLRSIARTESLESVTTSSIEALRKYTSASNGLDRGLISAPVAQQLFREAVGLDSTFASANRALAIAIFNFGGDRELMKASAEAAYRHRDRLPERERLVTEAFYHRFTGDTDEAARAYRAMLALDPDNNPAATNLADIMIYQGKYEEAIEASRQAPDWNQNAWAFNLLASLAATGRVEAALAVRDTFSATVPDDPYYTWVRVMVYSTSGEPQRALEIFRNAPPNSDALAYAYERYAGAVAAAGAGQLGTSAELLRGATAQLMDQSGPENTWAIGQAQPWVTLLMREDTAQALAEVDELQRTVGWERLSAYNRGYPMLALFYAVAGRTDEAEALLDRFDAEVASGADRTMLEVAATARATVAVRRGTTGALEQLDDALAGIGCLRCADLLYGLVHESAGDHQNAVARYERYVDRPFFDGGSYLLHFFGPTVHERLGRLYDEQGDSAQAAEHYLAFASQWSDADPDLRARVEHARRRAEELSRAP
jgi:tetratricopeptide (TPR) repeat protein